MEVRRLGGDTVFRPLDPATHAFRSALSRHCCLAEATGAAFESDNAFELPLALRALFAEGLVIDYGISSVDPAA